MLNYDIGIRENENHEWEVVKYVNPKYARGNGAYAGMMYDYDEDIVISTHPTREAARKAARF